jgi:polygalacturonase
MTRFAVGANITRRDFFRTAAIGAAATGSIGMFGCTSARVGAEAGAGWDRVPDILSRIRAPTFPDRDFPITSFGAVAGGPDATGAFRRAVDACSAAGGGRVVVPAGRWPTGAIHLRSNVNLHVSEGATIAFSTDPRAYLPAVFTRYEGVEYIGYSPLIYAFEQENIAVTGAGTLDGQASNEHWWPWTGAARFGAREGGPSSRPSIDRMKVMAEAGAPVAERVFAEGHYLRPQFLQPYRCTSVLIENVTIRNSPMWEIHPVLSRNVTVRGVRIESHGPNNDGCDPESCSDVLIENCWFDTGDDCIALKSGRNADGRRLAAPIENVVIRNCQMKDGHGGVTIGSEISGGARNIFAYDCTMDSPQLDRALRFKTNRMRGGVVEHIYMRDCTVGVVADAVVHADFHYDEGANGPFTPVIRDVHVSRVSSRSSPYALYLRALPGAPITGIHLEECRFDDVTRGNLLEHVEDLRLDDVRINGRLVTAAELLAASPS